MVNAQLMPQVFFFENQLMPELAGSFFVEIYAFFFEIVYTSQLDVCPASK